MNEIKRICEERSISPYDLSKIAGVSQSVLSKVINGKIRNPSSGFLIKIADALDVTLDELVGRKGKECLGAFRPQKKGCKYPVSDDEFQC